MIRISKPLPYNTRSPGSTLSLASPTLLILQHGSLGRSSGSNPEDLRFTDCVQGDFCLAIIALFLPPLSALKKTGCDHHFFISIILTFFGWTPGILYAWYIILHFPHGKRAANMRRRVRRDRASIFQEEYRVYPDEAGNYYYQQTRYRY